MGILDKIPKQNDLHRFIMDQDWEAAKIHLKHHPKDARQWAKIAFDNDKFSEMVPLHQALHRYAPIEFLRDLTEAYPKAAMKQDSYFGRFPLHFACLNTPYPELVTFLIEQNREAAFAQDKLGRVPLHYACFGKAHEYVIRSLLDVYPKGAQVKDHNSWLPLHVAVRYNCSHGAIERLVRVYPKSLQAKTAKSSLQPSDIAKKFNIDQEEKTKMLLRVSDKNDLRRSSKFSEYPRPDLREIDAEAV
jgi:hypothetical protein